MKNQRGEVSTINESIIPGNQFRPIEELNLIDNFLFHTVVTQGEDGEEFCRILLSTILGKRIRTVRVVAQQSIPGLDTNLHGIRMDAYVEDVSVEAEMSGCEMADAKVIPDIYDIEPDRGYEKDSLPKRMRYYHGLIDSKQLDSGADYDKLPRVMIIVILPYDPFGRNRMVYTVKNQCVEDSTILYEDGARKIFLYTKGTEGNPSQSLQDMLKYIEDTKLENVTNEDIFRIHEFVEKAKHRKEVSIGYMNLWEDKIIIEKQAHQIGLAEGREEGLELGRIEGHEIGKIEGRAEGRAEGRVEGRAETIGTLIETCQEFNLTKKDTLLKIMNCGNTSEQEALEYLEKYWK